MFSEVVIRAGQSYGVGVLRRPVSAGVAIHQVDIDITRIEQQTRLVDRRPRFHARQRHQRHAGAQRQQEQPPHQGGSEALAADGALATVGAGGGAAASGRGTETSDGAPAAGGAGTAVDGEGVSASIDGASSSPSSVHQITGTVSLYPPFGYRRDVLKANVVAVFERLAQFRNTLRDDVAGHNVPGPDVFDKLVPAKHFPGWRAKRPEDRLNAVQG